MNRSSNSLWCKSLWLRPVLWERLLPQAARTFLPAWDKNQSSYPRAQRLPNSMSSDESGEKFRLRKEIGDPKTGVWKVSIGEAMIYRDPRKGFPQQVDQCSSEIKQDPQQPLRNLTGILKRESHQETEALDTGAVFSHWKRARVPFSMIVAANRERAREHAAV